MIIPFDKQAHLEALRQLVIELQDYERELEPRLPPGAAIVDEYVPQMLLRCKQAVGQILIAEIDAEVAGFVTVLTRVSSGEIEDGDIEYGLISDLVVAPRFRRQGLGKELLEAGENFARSKKVSSLRIGVLHSNRAAMNLYAANGFSVLFSEMEKKLDP
ncbi:MAG TPA: GNAT family N-acetyltransferase [Woeseiaceae bacterium]|nr:GNAT family N-acetyltransferase [Woeseiaceae bacterium]